MSDLDDLSTDPATDAAAGRLGPALRDRLAHEQPRLEHLAASSLAAGRRLRRRRRLAAGAGGVAALAGIAALALVTGDAGGLGGSRVVDDTPVAASPAPDQLYVGRVLDLGDGLTGTVADDRTGLYELGASTLPGAGTGFVVVVSGPRPAVEAWWSEGFGTLTEDWPGVAVAVSMADAKALGMLGKVEQAPVVVPDGWTCEWFLVDDKAACASDDGGVASLVIRDAADRAAWVGSADKGATPGVYTTESHDGIFISVQGGRGTTDAEIQDLGKGLTWVD